jgi:hypothetical protein
MDISTDVRAGAVVKRLLVTYVEDQDGDAYGAG